MNCDQVRRLLSERLDQPLPPDQAASVRAHLAGCRECRAFERALTSSVAGLEALPRSLGSPRVRDGVRAYVTGLDDRAARGVSGAWLRQVGAFAGAAVVLVAVSALLIVLLNGRAVGTPQFGASPAANSPVPPDQVVASTTYSPSTPAPATPPPFVAEATPPVSPVTPAATPTPVTVSAAVAQQTVVGYFHAINQHNYAAAYALLGSGLQGQSLDDFARGFATTQRDTVTPTSIAPGGGGMVVSMVLIAVQTDGSVKTYRGTYTVGWEDGAVRIVRADVLEDTPQSPATPAATPAALSSCPADLLTMGLNAQGATGNLAIAVVFKNDGAPCQLVGPLSVTISDPVAGNLPIQGNGEAVPVNLAVGNVDASVSFLWSNWCGSQRQFVITAAVGGTSATLDLSLAPPCNASSGPSQLHEVSQATWFGRVVSNTPGTGTLTVRFPDGTTRRVVVGDGTVVTDARGNVVRAADIEPGARISASGDVSADATAMDAAVVVIEP